ncbi:MAG: porin family protein [Chloroherpetonaceae bacterium]|nr:porin family protein [Chloroherpetonaceae bacterium]MDW8437446.1 outer membrane beta-barrel protein [Chloroherpetonaceae bacterium]
MKLVGILFFTVGFFVSRADAQDITAKTKRDDAALLFQFSGFGNLATGGLGAVETPKDASGASVIVMNGVGGKFFMAENLALRAALTFARESASQPRSRNVAEFSETTTSVGIEIGAEAHLHNKRLSPYFGGLVGYGNGSFSRKQGGVEVSAKRSGFGIAAIAGAEFFLFEQVSLAAEYRAVFQRSSASNSLSSGTVVDAPAQTKIGFYSQGFLTLGLYLR